MSDHEFRMPRFLRMRSLLTIIAPALILLGLFLTDPDADGATTRLYLLRLVSVILAATCAHAVTKWREDYKEADTRYLYRLVRESSTRGMAAALALLAKAVVFSVLFMGFLSAARAQDVRTYVPAKCVHVAQLLKVEQRSIWRDHARPEMLAALAEQESCITLKSSRCCSTSARLKTQREEGASFLQVTRTWRKDGTQRFDTLDELRQKHPALKDWSWENVYHREDLSARALVYKAQDVHKFMARIIHDPRERLDFADAGYNRGEGGVSQDRRLCAMTRGCDPQRWFGNVARTCAAQGVSLGKEYKGRGPCEISREHVENVSRVRAPKYVRLML